MELIRLQAAVFVLPKRSAVTQPQNAVSYFPEFNYQTYWRLLERMGGGRFEFQKNNYSTYKNRTHFSPIWMPDGKYEVNTWLIDGWTPVGMLSANLTDSLTIRGSLWQDWHIGPLAALKQEGKMAYERIASPPEVLYHYTNKENLPAILADGRIRKFQDKECWFCSSVENTLRLMELTVMNEGGLYIGINGIPKRSPKFQPDEYVILELTPRYQNGEWVKWNQEIDSRCSAEQKALAERIQQLKNRLSWRSEV